jgi:hypothetical protein
MSRWVVIPAALTCAVAAVLFAPFLLRERDLVASTPSPRPLFDVTFIPVPSGGRLCASDVTIPRDARQLRFQVRTFGRPGPPLQVSLRAPGYGAQAQVAAGYPDLATLAAPVRPPARDRLGSVCIEQRGRGEIALTGTTETRTLSRPRGSVNGGPVPADAYLAFYEGREASALSRVEAMIDRATAFRSSGVGPWLLWPLLVLTVVGVPAGIVLAVAKAARMDPP